MKIMTNLVLILALGAPAAAELAAPQLPSFDAALVRAGLAEKENIDIGAAFPGMQTCAFKAAENKTCVFACKDGSTVTRPAIQSSLVPNGCAKFVMVPAAAPKAAAAETVYANDRGCSVTVEERANGYTLFVKDGGRQAFLGVLKDYSSGDIGAFCSPAAAMLSGASLTLSCGEQHNGGAATRGLAVVEMSDGITAVRVRGEVKKGLGWKTDTEIACEGLRPVAAKAARAGGGISGTYDLKNSYGEGSVTVRQFSEGGEEKAEFRLFTVAGPNAHIAEIGGVAVRGADGAFVFDGEDGCRLALRASGRGLRISGADATCGAYMGLGAIADGEYLKKN